MVPELELLEQLGGGPSNYMLMEEHVFASDRARFLRSLVRMLELGLVRIEIGSYHVEHWKIEEWRRLPYSPETTTDLTRVKLSITDKAVNYEHFGIKPD